MKNMQNISQNERWLSKVLGFQLNILTLTLSLSFKKNRRQCLIINSVDWCCMG